MRLIWLPKRYRIPIKMSNGNWPLDTVFHLKSSTFHGYAGL